MSLYKNGNDANSAPKHAPSLVSKAHGDANVRSTMVANGLLTSVNTSQVHAAGNGGITAVGLNYGGYGYQATPTIAFSNTGSGGVANAIMQLVDVAVTHGGDNYAPGDILTITGTGGTSTANATLNVTSTEIRSATVANVGSGYANGDIIAVTGGTGTPATFTVTTGAANTSVASVALSVTGTYTANPTTTNVATSNATGAGVGARLNLVTKVKTLGIANAGNYSVLPTTLANNVTANSTGVGVSCNVNLFFGIKQINVANAGTYTSTPTVTITGNTNGGNAAAAVAIVSLGGGKGITHTGWNLKTVGRGARAGRIFYECLVAQGSQS